MALIKTTQEIEKMRVAGKLAASVLDMIEPHVTAGTTTNQLNDICHSYITKDLNCIPAPLNYKGFPKSICTSINHQVCHGIPNDKPLKSGDILNIDVTVIKDKYHGDTSKMYFIGKPKPHAERLVAKTYEAMWAGIYRVRPDAHLGDIGSVIQTLAEGCRYSVVRDFCGHGIGDSFHEEPQVLHYGKPGKGMKLQTGMTFTIEPMINQGDKATRVLNDQWTAVTKDGSLSAQWEHTILVTDSGYEVLTLRESEKAMLEAIV